MAAKAAALLQRIADALDQSHAEALNAEQAATFCGISRAAWLSQNSSGMTPASTNIGDMRSPRWIRSELRAWLLAGCPSRAIWTQRREQTIRRLGNG